MVACVHAAPGLAPEVIVTMQNGTEHDVCAVRLWSDDDATAAAENRLLPGAALLEPTSTFRLHTGERRDFVVPAHAPLRMEAVDCSGQLLESLELAARPGSVVALELGDVSRGGFSGSR